jgi:crossover junction endodeoxyribonuclease RuvC
LSIVILGLDPGTATTGYGVIKKEANGLSCISFGCIKTPAGLELAKRFTLIREGLVSVIKKYNPDYSAIEKLFFTKNVKTAISVSHARGVVLEALNEYTLPIYEYTPLQVKQAVTSYGKADKIQIQKMVRVLLSMKEIPKPDDAADALAVAICCAHSVHNDINND